ncbi:MAG: DUF1292 domain-containing protein [Clostridia bacterium]|nr:DUF1292 domain-containing protein [Clostridia bacterium]
MAEEIKNVNVEEEEEDIITLEFDDDTAVDCYVMGTFELGDKEYIALEPEDGTDDVYIYGYKQISDDEFEIIEIEDEETPLTDELDEAPEVEEPVVEEIEIEIPDEESPLADVPKTGDAMLIYSAMAAVSGIGLAWVGMKKKN